VNILSEHILKSFVLWPLQNLLYFWFFYFNFFFFIYLLF